MSITNGYLSGDDELPEDDTVLRSGEKPRRDKFDVVTSWLFQFDPDGADPESRLKTMARQVVNRFGMNLGREELLDAFDRGYVRRMYRPAPDHVVAEAVDAALRQAAERWKKPQLSPPAAATAESAAKQFEFIDGAAFLDADYRQQFLIEHILTAGEPGTVAGPSKTLKTSIVGDAAVSLASGTPFLSTFNVPAKTRVAIVSGESGKAALQRTCRRVMEAKGIGGDALGDRLRWCFELPRFPDLANMATFAERLLAFEAQVVFIDPVYLCVGADVEHGNLFQMGAAFRVVGEMLLSRKVTPVLVHHANRSLKVGEVMEITHLAFSGLEQFARQWLLINRQTSYRGDGNHDLHLNAGGSAGHSGLYHARVEEGIADNNFAGRKWDVSVVSANELVAQNAERKATKVREAELQRVREHGTRVLEAIDAAVKAGDPAATKNGIKERAKLKTTQVDDAIVALHEEGVIEVHGFKKALNNGAKRDVIGWRRRTRHPEPAAILDNTPDAPPQPTTRLPKAKRKVKRNNRDNRGGPVVPPDVPVVGGEQPVHPGQPVK